MGTASNHEIIRTLEAAGAGKLEVYTAYVDGVEVSKAFTLASLAFVLDLPLPTIEGRYARARLKLWKVDIPSRAGRPMRGFPYSKLQGVLTIMRTPRAVVQHDPNTDAIIPLRSSGAYPLVVTTHAGEDYYTVAALADHFGMSPTTIRKKLSQAGLASSAVNLGSTLQGGRPTRGYPSSMRGQLKLAIEAGVPFRNQVDRMLVDAGTIEQARSEMDQASVSRPPAPLDRSTAQPSSGAKVMHFPTAGRMEDPRDQGTAALVAEINGIMSKAVIPEAIEPRLPDTSDYRITAGEFKVMFETCRHRHLSDTSSLPSTEHMSADISSLNSHAKAAGLEDLVMTPAQVHDLVEQWSAEWRSARAEREPEIVSVREMLWAAMTARDDKPTVEEIWAASTVFAYTRPMTSEVRAFREQVASHHQMLKIVRASIPAEVRVTQAYTDAETRLVEVLEAKQAQMSAQRRAADRVFSRMIEDADVPDEITLSIVQQKMIDQGIHPTYAQGALDKVRWYFGEANAPRSAA